MKPAIKFLAVSMACLLLAGCGGQGVSIQKTKINLLHGWGGSGSDHAAMRKIYSDFAVQNPDIELAFDAQSDISIVQQKAGNLLAADSMPDILSTNGHVAMMENARKKGFALDLAPYIKADSDFSDNIASNVFSIWAEDDGALYSLPEVWEAIGYWYNEDLFRKAGITDNGLPTGNVRLPQTWEEFWATCEKLANAGIQTGVYPSEQMRWLLGARLAAQPGQSRDFMLGNAAACNEDEARQAIEELVRECARQAEDSISVRDDRQRFFDGKTAMHFNGVWASAEQGLTTNGQAIQYASFPSADGKSVSYLYTTTGYVVSDNLSAEKTDACIRFLKYMMSEEVQQRIAVETRQVPVNPKISNEWLTQQMPVLGQAMQTCTASDVHLLSFFLLLPEKENQLMDDCFWRLGKDAAAQEELLSILTDSEK